MDKIQCKLKTQQTPVLKDVDKALLKLDMVHMKKQKVNLAQNLTSQCQDKQTVHVSKQYGAPLILFLYTRTMAQSE